MSGMFGNGDVYFALADFCGLMGIGAHTKETEGQEELSKLLNLFSYAHTS